MGNVLPVLGAKEWSSDPIDIMTTLFVNAVLANKSQSTIFKDKIISLPYIIATSSHMPSELCSEIKRELGILYSRYFSRVEVIVRSSITDFSGESQYEIYITIEADGLSLNRALGVSGNKLLDLIEETQQ